MAKPVTETPPAPAAATPSVTAQPTAAELADLGVELTPPVITEAEPARAKFVEFDLPDEPETDRKIKVDGTNMRERVSIIHSQVEGVVTPEGEAAPNVMIVGISNALLDSKDKVVKTADDKPKIATCYPVTFTAEALGRIGTPEKLRQALLIHREQAAAKAKLEFDGMAIADGLNRKRD